MSNISKETSKSHSILNLPSHNHRQKKNASTIWQDKNRFIFPYPTDGPKAGGLGQRYANQIMVSRSGTTPPPSPPTSVKIPQPGALQEVRGPPKIVMMTSINLVLGGGGGRPQRVWQKNGHSFVKGR